jgi:hypothetical protein
MDHVFALELHRAELRIEKCDIEAQVRVLEIRYLDGIVRLKDVVIEGIMIGPAIIVFNEAHIEAGLISIEGLTIVRSVFSEYTLLLHHSGLKHRSAHDKTESTRRQFDRGDKWHLLLQRSGVE